MLSTTELLQKVRKGAWASFTASQWATVMTELGFKWTVTQKQGRKVTQVRVESDTHEFTYTKEPRYKRITFYSLPGDIATTGLTLQEMASVKLNLPTIEQEREAKAIKARDWTNTGTCPVCEANVKLNDHRGLVHHGFRRPGHGSIEGDCFAVNDKPWELSSGAAVRYLGWLKSELEAAKVVEGTLDMHRFDGNSIYTSPVTRNHFQYVERLEKEIAYFTAKIAGWKFDTLPEEKYKSDLLFGEP